MVIKLGRKGNLQPYQIRSPTKKLGLNQKLMLKSCKCHPTKYPLLAELSMGPRSPGLTAACQISTSLPIRLMMMSKARTLRC